MKASLKSLSDNIAQANDLFYLNNKSLDTVIGIMDKSLRKQGMQAEAISIDCVPLNKKIVFLLHDAKPDQADIAFGNKAGDINSTRQISLSELTVPVILTFMQEYFT
ncbi:hypothetical protein CW745_11965 [Psychromonas sp. psych-6C06]|uniref:hypothetical protein n=1 Tax=Psychromonas sp. psych-6C06 TaxID=2058089 RepID=UPI000C33C4E5|nr:hypothetical protein [Psychromonas sp. psych-6C06]PKF61021.1 hypothetical protein CW745_11965 [Psychromonas sp. psych-6C06]